MNENNQKGNGLFGFILFLLVVATLSLVVPYVLNERTFNEPDPVNEEYFKAIKKAELMNDIPLPVGEWVSTFTYDDRKGQVDFIISDAGDFFMKQAAWDLDETEIASRTLTGNLTIQGHVMTASNLQGAKGFLPTGGKIVVNSLDGNAMTLLENDESLTHIVFGKEQN